jgi:orotate phosphoribosyltransferase
LRLEAIKFGNFTLTSGKKSEYYVDIKDASTNPEFLREVASELAGRVDSGSMVAGVELGAVPLVVATAVKLGVPYLIIRKEERTHGNKETVIGKVEKGRQVDITEDVVTTGNSVLRAVKLLRDKGAIVNKVICVVDREEGGTALLSTNKVDLIPLVRMSEVMSR